MLVKILFFGPTADITGQRRLDLELPLRSKAKDLFEMLVSQFPLLESRQLHFAVNEEYATGNEILSDGDEVAIFAAVSGG